LKKKKKKKKKKKNQAYGFVGYLGSSNLPKKRTSSLFLCRGLDRFTKGKERWDNGDGWSKVRAI
jgi:hypothetical protein